MTNPERAARRAARKIRFYESPVRITIALGGIIFVAEAVVMVVMVHVLRFPGRAPVVDLFTDSLMLLLLIAPFLHRFIFKPMAAQIAQREEAETRLRRYQSNLESLVEDRTARLTEAIEELEREIVERKRTEEALLRSEERFRQLFEQTEDAIILFRPGGCRIIDVNPVAERLYGFSKKEFFELGLESLMGPSDLDTFCRAIGQVRMGDSIRIDTMTHTRKDGSEVIVSVRGKMVTIQQVDMVYCTIRDISKRIRLEKESRLIQARLIHTNKMTSLGVLVASIAHEINNPNNYIMVNSEILRRSWNDIYPILRDYYDEHGDFTIGGIPFSEMREAFPELIAGVHDGARRIRDIVNNLKDFARNEACSIAGNVDVNRAITMAATMLNHQIRKHTRHFRLELAEDLPLVRGSLQQLEQVIINLIMNAIQALPTEERGVTVSTTRDGNDGGVVIRVADQGSGIPIEISDSILEPFFTTRLDSGGTGLGLAICHSIVRDHGGDLEFTSVPGEGTIFTVHLPAASNQGVA
ncbi:PAS domain S-box protein [Geobacter sulfurreducens]|uniref:histidine kinase n=1 Tax=Geobacter sulfurreducens (strain ATCC 51573 / DSM 12127 / PCA) TaxID=243231 RepID=Q74DR6_GEOSL|nr:ATP-binding protein [Geobacter sulfurreducens]AAR34625.1 sensor histidine kinase, PAS domain-containing [Geobacter sulfurreducens PCA]AJY70959.1 histidine kinase [Geobacter sulfurreducens]UAC05278.1 PAS domain S-box protein [Geobacter sulfurreducens]UTG93915.1 PAS domain S-box protein [Geobacter sulfurreducens]HBB69128.1 PAS domain-containing sensor histidine kinase [Geobacter sulfurreducens]